MIIDIISSSISMCFSIVSIVITTIISFIMFIIIVIISISVMVPHLLDLRLVEPHHAHLVSGV